MTTPPEDIQLNAANQLVRLKQIVKHLASTWPLVLRRLTIMKSMGRNDELRGALKGTYAAHVHNTIQDVLIIDLIREIAALILDNDKRSASARRAVAILHNDAVLNELEKEYNVVDPRPRIYDEDHLNPVQGRALKTQFQHYERESAAKEFRTLRRRLEGQGEVAFRSGIGTRILTARNKAVAHYDIVRHGTDWRMWRLGDTALTYGDVDAYVDMCTSLVDMLNLLVRRESSDFKACKDIDEEYAKEYVAALLIGLRAQREKRQDQGV